MDVFILKSFDRLGVDLDLASVERAFGNSQKCSRSSSLTI